MNDSRNIGPVEKQIRLGVLTPSSNTALEPLTSALVATVPGVSAHFSRFRVTEIGLDQRSERQFEIETIVEAANLLADANVDVIGWSGTSAGWLGFERDLALCEQIETATGIAATTSVLALNELLAGLDVRRVALYTPYTADVQARIIDNYRRIGIECRAERHLGIRTNYEFARVPPEDIEADCAALLDASDAEAVITLCTNLRAAQLAERIEHGRAAMLLDTVSTVVWKMLALAGRDPTRVKGWGRIFEVPAR
ncbi:MAG: aspartate/glutamate racemase family protein [Gammaproteobacteria bacterium]|nr:aspartate/glutamate racemase family protein [Gammaproteobacteria bacterium]